MTMTISTETCHNEPYTQKPVITIQTYKNLSERTRRIETKKNQACKTCYNKPDVKQTFYNEPVTKITNMER